MLTREAILAAQQLKTETVTATGWGGEVTVRELTAVDRLDFFSALEKITEAETDKKRVDLLASALFVCRTVVDEQGCRMFSDDDAELLIQKNEATLNRVANVAGVLNGIIPAEQTAGKSKPGRASSPSPSA